MRGPKPERRTTFVPSTVGSVACKSMSFPSTERSAGHPTTVPWRKLAAITAKRTCFITASSSASGRSPASHQRTHHSKTASSLLATSRSSCTSTSTSAPVASCGGSSSKPRSAASTAAFSSAGSVKVSASRHTLSALHGASRAPIASAHASLSASTMRRADASSTSTKASSALSTAGLMPWSAWVASAASRMPDSKRFRKYPEHDASATRCALNSTPSALRAKSVSRSSRQRAMSEVWCGTPPLRVILGAAAVAGCEEEDEALAAAVVRARFFGGMERVKAKIKLLKTPVVHPRPARQPALPTCLEDAALARAMTTPPAPPALPAPPVLPTPPVPPALPPPLARPVEPSCGWRQCA
eukprot:scaffold40_cov66-Phaeocystis_antarctica.AAC.5